MSLKTKRQRLTKKSDRPTPKAVPAVNLTEGQRGTPSQSSVIYVKGTPEQRERNKPLLAKLQRELEEISAMTKEQRDQAARDYKKFEATFRANAMSNRNRSHG